MIATLKPMLAEPSLVGLGILLIVAIFMIITIPTAVVAFVLLLRRGNGANQNLGSASAPQSASFNRRLWILLGLLVATGAGTLLNFTLHIKTPTGDYHQPTKFFQLLDSNRIVQATIDYDPNSPVYEITGTYRTDESTNGHKVAQFWTKAVMSEKQLNQLESLPNVTVREHQSEFSILSLFLALLLLLVFIGLTIAVIIIIVRAIFKNRASPLAAPPVQPNLAPQALRQCPKCGAQLRSDLPEGLCPACLLQHGIATEGGVPPGTPAFTPPPLSDLAKLFPQLEILEIIGQGGMGAVYKARQPSLDRFVALKILAPRSGGDLDFAGRFGREARALAKLSHPNIVSVYDFGQVQRTPGADPRPSTLDAQFLSYFVMEFVDGPNLRQVEQAGKLTPREALQIIPQICAALQFAHDEGIVHRDIKPENVLLDKKGRVKIADFGLAKILGQDADFRLTGARDVMGTPHYMAPEQVEKPQEVDHRADIYSLGVVFYEMLTGELPLGKFDPPSHKVQIDVRLDDVVLRSLANNPDRRYQHVSEVKTELDSIAHTPPPQGAAPRVNPIYQGVDYRSRFSLFGLPLLHITSGVDPESGKVRVANGIIAIGGRAQGVVAIGGLAIGGFAIGGGAIGIVAFGGAALGVFSFGGLAIALMLALGGGAIAPIALGGGAFGYMATGGGAFGAHVSAANFHDAVARQFFGTWGPALLAGTQYLNALMILIGVGLGVGAPLWARRFGESSDASPILAAIRAWLTVMDRGDYGRSWELAAPYFQSTLKKEEWIGKSESIRRPLGAVHSRDLCGLHFTGKTQGQVRFQTTFDGPLTAVETVTFSRQADENWKAIGYLIKPAPGRKLIAWPLLWVAALAIAIAVLVAALVWLHQVTIPLNEASLFAPPTALPRQTTRPFGANSTADFHYQVFECDAATVDKLIPAGQRQKSGPPEPASTSSNFVTKEIIHGNFKMIRRKLSGTDAQIAMVDPNTLEELEKGVTDGLGMLADRHRNVYSPFWDPGMAETWNYARDGYLGGAGGTLSMRRLNDQLQVHVNIHLHHTEIQAGSPNGDLDSQIFYEGPAPTDALVFLVPFLRQDRSEHYLIVAFEIVDLGSGNIEAISKNSKAELPVTNVEPVIDAPASGTNRP